MQETLVARTDVNCAQEIMGCNFFGFEENVRYLGVFITQNQLAEFSEIPFSMETLEQFKSTHVLQLHLDVSIFDIRERVPRKLFYKHEEACYNNEPRAFSYGRFGWHLIRKTPADGSMEKTWDLQQQFVGEDETVPAAHTMVYAIIGHYLVTGERLLEKSYVRTETVSLINGRRFRIGHFDSDGLRIDFRWDARYDPDLGIASEIKINEE